MGLKNVKYNFTGGKRGWAGDVPRFLLDASKLNKIGWKPNYTSDEAVRKSIREVLKLE
jgi:UDP-glucose 4-epimerase